MKKLFQSYLIIGNGKRCRQRTIELIKSFGVDFKRAQTDLFIIAPQTTVSQGRQSHITIDQVRQLKSHIFQKPITQKYKFVIIEQAENLTIEAQNALLKMLEEPPKTCIIILEAKDKSNLLATIISRLITIQTLADPNEAVPKESSILLEEVKVALEKLAEIKNPLVWLDKQILANHNLLLYETSKNLTKPHPKQTKKSISLQEVCQFIESCAKTKEMIQANVNPKMALYNLVFTGNLASK